MATGSTKVDTDTSENSDEHNENPPLQEAKDSQYQRKESQNSFVSIDLDFQERIYNTGYDQDIKGDNPINKGDNVTQYDESFYQPTSQIYTNLGQKRYEYDYSDSQKNSGLNRIDKWKNGGIERNLHIKIKHKKDEKGSLPASNQYHAGYDQPLTQIPTFSTNFHIGFSNQRLQNTAANVEVQPKAKPAFFKPDVPYSMLIPAIFACFCCLPTGICAIISAMNAKKCFENGELITAQIYTTKTQRFTLVSMVIGLIWITALIVVLTTNSSGNTTS